jgi:hypothetical protein
VTKQTERKPGPSEGILGGLVFYGQVGYGAKQAGERGPEWHSAERAIHSGKTQGAGGLWAGARWLCVALVSRMGSEIPYEIDILLNY